MIDKGLMYKETSKRPKLNHVEHLSLEKQKQNDNSIRRHAVSDQSDKMMIIGKQYRKIQTRCETVYKERVIK